MLMSMVRGFTGRLLSSQSVLPSSEMLGALITSVAHRKHSAMVMNAAVQPCGSSPSTVTRVSR